MKVVPMHRGDALAENRHALSRVRIDKHYEFDSAQGRVTLAGLFRDKSQLFAQHALRGPSQPLQCLGCALGVDGLESLLPHFENHDVSVVAIARATTEGLAESGAVDHAYPNYSRGVEDYMTIYRPRNMWGKGGEVATNGRINPPMSCCM